MKRLLDERYLLDTSVVPSGFLIETMAETVAADSCRLIRWPALPENATAAFCPGTDIDNVVLGPPAVTDTLNGTVGDTDAISNGEKKAFLGIEIEAVPMYNLKLGSEPGKPFHHKGIGNGYILTFGDTRVYFSGDTECVPEMRTLKNISVAFVAMNPPRTMPPAEAAACVAAFRPKIVYPYHYRGQNTQEFADALKNTPGIEVRLRKLEGEP